MGKLKIIKPPALHRGDVIGIISPASPVSSDEKIEKGVIYLEQLGYKVKLGKHVRATHGYLAGTDSNRAHDINDMFKDKQVKAIFSLRGGYGTPRLLPLINYKLIKQNPNNPNQNKSTKPSTTTENKSTKPSTTTENK